MNKNIPKESMLSISMNDFTDAVAEVIYRKGYKVVVTFDEIVQYALEKRKDNAKIAAFSISVKKNYDPQNENDKLIIIQGLLDENYKPISLDNRTSESRIIHTRTIDKRLLDVLNGEETKIIRL